MTIKRRHIKMALCAYKLVACFGASGSNVGKLATDRAFYAIERWHRAAHGRKA